MNSTITPLESTYKGWRFRSRMEARWGVFMDVLGVPFHYEPEGYDLDGVCYLPDFYLPQQDVFMEVKSPADESNWKTKIERLSEATLRRVFVCTTPPSPPDNLCVERGIYDGIYFVDWSPEDGSCWEDYSQEWCECPHCGRCEIQFGGRADRIKCKCPKSRHGDRGHNAESPRLMKAYHASRGYRFDEIKNHP